MRPTALPNSIRSARGLKPADQAPARVCPVDGRGHHIRVEPPNGPTVSGYCLKCGVTREYPSAPNEDDKPSGRDRS